MDQSLHARDVVHKKARRCARYLFILQHSDNHQQSLMINTRLLAAFFFNVISIHAEKDDRNLFSKQTETTPGQPDVHIDCKSYISRTCLTLKLTFIISLED
ncbi:unnamed protein product [Albugo candida]|uniref:Uncharacterized protein n=1 Tax=Albugo candida TaxID=65357 RepID=A0A024FXZ0_9STRA|nr:unnamed protein product [Albugo candida]|eukprot:CCI11797.1 unnamed protein product [Albugo candida]